MTTKIEILCDKCGADISLDIMEQQEALRWSMDCGYGSVFGDMNHATLDLCQRCVKGLLGEYVQINGEKA